jgi:putative ABC transport system permease protein
METLLQDVRYGARMLRKSPGFTAVAVVTLALGIGANLAMFSLVEELWMRPRPVPHAERVVRIFTSNPTSEGVVEQGESSYPDYLDIDRRSKSFAGVAALEMRGGMLYTRGQGKLVTVAVVSGNFFDVLQPTPARGRTFTAKEAGRPGAPVVMLSYPFWRQQFDGDAALPGHTIVLDRKEVLVAGVLPRGFRGPEPTLVPDVWMPVESWGGLMGDKERLVMRGRRSFELFGRLKAGVPVQQANAELQTIAAALAREYPGSNRGREMRAAPESAVRSGSLRQLTLVLLAISGLVLLIACANVASLLIVRAEYRHSELAVRVALGASRGRLFLQMFSETAVLAMLAGAAALWLGGELMWLIPAALPHPSFTTAVDTHMDGRVLLLAVVAALISMLACGAGPAWQASRSAPAEFLKQRRLGGSTRALARTTLVVAQVAVSLVLVVGAGLLVRSLLNSQAANPGFDAHQNMLVMEMVPGFGIKSEQGSREFVQEARRRIEALPGVAGTAAGMRIPFSLSGSGATRKVFLPGGAESGIAVHYDPVSDRFFEMLGTRLLRGRAIDAQDLQTGAQVMVINRTMAQRFWPGQDALGKQLRLDKADGSLYQVVGEVEDAKSNELAEDPMPYLYTPMTSDDYSELVLMVKTNADPSAVATPVRQTLRELNGDVPIIYFATMREHMRLATEEQRTAAGLIVSLSGLGLLLAAVGLYGLTAFLVGRRTQEIGIRMALGAQRAAIFGLVIRHALLLTAVGTIVGAVAAVPATSALRALLFGVRPHDVGAFAIAAVVLAAVACGAALIPALRATRVDPMEALRYE